MAPLCKYALCVHLSFVFSYRSILSDDNIQSSDWCFVTVCNKQAITKQADVITDVCWFLVESAAWKKCKLWQQLHLVDFMQTWILL